jgi:hypothetical protein
MEMSRHLPALVALSPGGITPAIHCIGGWVGRSASLEAVARRKNSNLSEIEPRSSSP